MGTEWDNNGYNNEEGNEQDYAFQTVTRTGKPKTLGWSIASLITGAVSIMTFAFGWSSIILGAVAIIIAIVSRKTLGYFDGKTIAGLILGIHGMLLGITAVSFVLTMGDEENNMLWDYIKQMFEQMENNSGGGNNF